MKGKPATIDVSVDRLVGSVERITFHSEEP